MKLLSRYRGLQCRDHGKAFATNFNPEINIREVTQKGKYWEKREMDRNRTARNT